MFSKSGTPGKVKKSLKQVSRPLNPLGPLVSNVGDQEVAPLAQQPLLTSRVSLDGVNVEILDEK